MADDEDPEEIAAALQESNIEIPEAPDDAGPEIPEDAGPEIPEDAGPEIPSPTASKASKMSKIQSLISTILQSRSSLGSDKSQPIEEGAVDESGSQNFQEGGSVLDESSRSQEELRKSQELPLNGKKVSLDELSKNMSQSSQRFRTTRMHRQCQRRFREMIGKREMKNEELEKQQGDLQQRLNILECSMPAVMVWNIWRMCQGSGILSLKQVLEKQFQGPASGEVYCPSTPSRHFDCRVREVEAERKQAQSRAEEARALWAEKQVVLDEKSKKLEEAKQTQDQLKKNIENLKIEVQKLREEAANKVKDEGACETGECGVIECKKKWLQNVSSSASIKSTDIECLDKLQQLAETELCMKRQIADLERREEAYMRTLQQADELWAKLQGDAACTLSTLQEQLDLKTSANQQMADRIVQLEDMLEKLRARLATCRGELEKYMSISKIEALIGRDDDFADAFDQEVDAVGSQADKMIGGEDDLAGVHDVGVTSKDEMLEKDALARPDIDEAQLGIKPEDFALEEQKLDEAKDYLASYGSLSELFADDDFICAPDFSCNDQVLTESGLTEEELAALKEGRVTAEMLLKKTGGDVVPPVMKKPDVAGIPDVTTSSIKEDELPGVEEEQVVLDEIIDEDDKTIDEGDMAIDEGGAAIDEGGLEIDEGGMAIDEGGMTIDEGGMAIDESDKAIDDEREMPESVIEETEEVVAVHEDFVEAPAHEAEIGEQMSMKDQVEDYTPPQDTADTTEILIPRGELISWQGSVDTIRETIAKCPDCISVKKNADNLAEKIARLTGTQMKEVVDDPRQRDKILEQVAPGEIEMRPEEKEKAESEVGKEAAPPSAAEQIAAAAEKRPEEGEPGKEEMAAPGAIETIPKAPSAEGEEVTIVPVEEIKVSEAGVVETKAVLPGEAEEVGEEVSPVAEELAEGEQLAAPEEKEEPSALEKEEEEMVELLEKEGEEAPKEEEIEMGLAEEKEEVPGEELEVEVLSEEEEELKVELLAEEEELKVELLSEEEEMLQEEEIKVEMLADMEEAPEVGGEEEVEEPPTAVEDEVTVVAAAVLPEKEELEVPEEAAEFEEEVQEVAIEQEIEIEEEGVAMLPEEKEAIKEEEVPAEGEEVMEVDLERCLDVTCIEEICLAEMESITEAIPKEEIPAEEIPAEEIPVEEIPVEEISVEEIPAEEIPAEGEEVIEIPVEKCTDETCLEEVCPAKMESIPELPEEVKLPCVCEDEPISKAEEAPETPETLPCICDEESEAAEMPETLPCVCSSETEVAAAEEEQKPPCVCSSETEVAAAEEAQKPPCVCSSVTEVPVTPAEEEAQKPPCVCSSVTEVPVTPAEEGQKPPCVCSSIPEVPEASVAEEGQKPPCVCSSVTEVPVTPVSEEGQKPPCICSTIPEEPEVPATEEAQKPPCICSSIPEEPKVPSPEEAQKSPCICSSIPEEPKVPSPEEAQKSPCICSSIPEEPKVPAPEETQKPPCVCSSIPEEPKVPAPEEAQKSPCVCSSIPEEPKGPAPEEAQKSPCVCSSVTEVPVTTVPEEAQKPPCICSFVPEGWKIPVSEEEQMLEEPEEPKAPVPEEAQMLEEPEASGSEEMGEFTCVCSTIPEEPQAPGPEEMGEFTCVCSTIPEKPKVPREKHDGPCICITIPAMSKAPVSRETQKPLYAFPPIPEAQEAPVPAPATKIEVTQTEIPRPAEAMQAVTQTVSDTGTQTPLLCRRIRKPQHPQTVSSSRPVNQETEMRGQLTRGNMSATEPSSTFNANTGCQTKKWSMLQFKTTGTDGRTSNARISHILQSLKADVAHLKSDPEEELKSIHYGKKPEQPEVGKCNCCMCGKDVSSSSMVDCKQSSSVSKQSSSPSSSRKAVPGVDQGVQHETMCPECKTKKLEMILRETKRPTCDKEVCAHASTRRGVPYERSRKKVNQSCTAKIPKAGSKTEKPLKRCKVDPEKEVREIMPATNVGTKESSMHCVCSAEGDSEGSGASSKVRCACGDPD